jgi:hypothetical protein
MARELGVEFTTAPIGLADDLVDYSIGESIEERRREWLPDAPAARAPSYRSDERDAHADLRGPLHAAVREPGDQPGRRRDAVLLRHAPGNSFGNLERSSFDEIWNNAAYRYSRSLFVRPLSSARRATCARTSAPAARTSASAGAQR